MKYGREGERNERKREERGEKRWRERERNGEREEGRTGHKKSNKMLKNALGKMFTMNSSARDYGMERFEKERTSKILELKKNTVLKVKHHRLVLISHRSHNIGRGQ